MVGWEGGRIPNAISYLLNIQQLVYSSCYLVFCLHPVPGQYQLLSHNFFIPYSWGLPVRISSQPQATPMSPTEPLSASSPPAENPWQRFAPTSPPGGAAASVCFSDIVQDQIEQKHTLERASQKPLHLIQVGLRLVSGSAAVCRCVRGHYRSWKTGKKLDFEKKNWWPAKLWNFWVFCQKSWIL